MAAATLSTSATAEVIDGKNDGLSAPNSSIDFACCERGVTRLSAIETSAAPERATAAAIKWMSREYGTKLIDNTASPAWMSARSATREVPSDPSNDTLERNKRQM